MRVTCRTRATRAQQTNDSYFFFVIQQIQYLSISFKPWKTFSYNLKVCKSGPRGLASGITINIYFSSRCLPEPGEASKYYLFFGRYLLPKYMPPRIILRYFVSFPTLTIIFHILVDTQPKSRSAHHAILEHKDIRTDRKRSSTGRRAVRHTLAHVAHEYHIRSDV